MQPTPELIDQLYREKILRARAMPLEEKLLSGLDQFDLACQFMRAGIQSQQPDADEAQVEVILRGQLRRLRAINDYRLYVPVVTEELADDE